MFESLSGRLNDVFSRLRSRGRLSEDDVNAALRRMMQDGMRDADGNPLAWDREAGAPVNALLPDIKPELAGLVETPEGVKARPVFEILANRYLDPRYSADEAAEPTSIGTNHLLPPLAVPTDRAGAPAGAAATGTG